MPYFVIIFVIEITNTFQITGKKKDVFHLFLHQALGVFVCVFVYVCVRERIVGKGTKRRRMKKGDLLTAVF